MNIYKFWKDVLAQNADAIRDYFDENAYINWHCTNEHFNVDEFIIANCEYPGNWGGEVERVEKIDDLLKLSMIKSPQLMNIGQMTEPRRTEGWRSRLGRQLQRIRYGSSNKGNAENYSCG